MTKEQLKEKLLVCNSLPEVLVIFKTELEVTLEELHDLFTPIERAEINSVTSNMKMTEIFTYSLNLLLDNVNSIKLDESLRILLPLIFNNETIKDELLHLGVNDEVLEKVDLIFGVPDNEFVCLLDKIINKKNKENKMKSELINVILGLESTGAVIKRIGNVIYYRTKAFNDRVVSEEIANGGTGDGIISGSEYVKLHADTDLLVIIHELYVNETLRSVVSDSIIESTLFEALGKDNTLDNLDVREHLNKLVNEQEKESEDTKQDEENDHKELKGFYEDHKETIKTTAKVVGGLALLGGLGYLAYRVFGSKQEDVSEKEVDVLIKQTQEVFR